MKKIIAFALTVCLVFAVAGVFASAVTLNPVENITSYTTPNVNGYGLEWYNDEEGEFKLFADGRKVTLEKSARFCYNGRRRYALRILTASPFRAFARLFSGRIPIAATHRFPYERIHKKEGKV